MRYLLILLALVCSSASADLVVSNGANELRLMQPACSNEGILQSLEYEWRQQFKQAQASIDGKLYAACWIKADEEAVFVMYETGDGVDYPIGAFTDHPGI